MVTKIDSTTELISSYRFHSYHLLSHEQEIAYGGQVQLMEEIEQHKKAFIKSHRREPNTSELAIASCKTESEVQLIVEQGQHAKKTMMMANIRLVISIAKKYQGQGFELADLIQEGFFGLNRAIEKFNPHLGYKFSTYATSWIKQLISRAIANKSRTIRLPLHLTEKIAKVKRTHRRTHQSVGRFASITEVALALKIKPDKVQELFQVSGQVISLDLLIGENRETPLSALLAANGITPQEAFDEELNREKLNKSLNYLTPRQREVIILRYGLDSGYPQNQVQVANLLNLSKARIWQIEYEAIRILRKHFDANPNALDKACLKF